LIMTDQQRADLCGREGYPLDVTPFVDRLARAGVDFRCAYTAAPVCAPARVSTLTGRFPSAHRVRENRGHEHVYYSRDLVDVVRGLGYATALVGKNHSHLTPERVDHAFLLSHDAGYSSKSHTSDDERAFDEWIHRLNHRTAIEPTPFPVESQSCSRAVSDAIQWIDGLTGGKERKPFFLWLSFPEPHNPYQVPEPYFSMFSPESIPPARTGRETLQAKGFKWELTRQLGEYVYSDYEEQLERSRPIYLGTLRMIDDQIARFVSHLEKTGMRENTLIIFMSDHGDFVGEYGLMRKGPEMPELLMRVPLVFSGPGVSGPRVEERFVSIVDILPTLCELLGAPLPAGVQGRSLLPVLRGGEVPPDELRSIYAEQGYGGLHYDEHDAIDFDHCTIPGPVDRSFDELNTYSQSGTMRMVRKGKWKLVQDMQGRGQLYDLEHDPLELENCYEDPGCREVRAEMTEELLTWLLRMQDPLPHPVNKYRIKLHPRNYWTDPGQ